MSIIKEHEDAEIIEAQQLASKKDPSLIGRLRDLKVLYQEYMSDRSPRAHFDSQQEFNDAYQLIDQVRIDTLLLTTFHQQLAPYVVEYPEDKEYNKHYWLINVYGEQPYQDTRHGLFCSAVIQHAYEAGYNDFKLALPKKFREHENDERPYYQTQESIGSFVTGTEDNPLKITYSGYYGERFGYFAKNTILHLPESYCPSTNRGQLRTGELAFQSTFIFGSDPAYNVGEHSSACTFLFPKGMYNQNKMAKTANSARKYTYSSDTPFTIERFNRLPERYKHQKTMQHGDIRIRLVK